MVELNAYFAGSWRLTRRIHDLKRREIGRFLGEARFAPDGPAAFDFTERGVLALPMMRSEARRDYRFEMTGSGFRVFFPDGRFFHEAIFAQGRADVAHDCPPDLYRGRYRMSGPDRWWLTWRIGGPRKDLMISSAFSRMRPAKQS